jgi:release factor glutamine methyltransferase
VENFFNRLKKWLLEEKYQNKITPLYFKDLKKLKKGVPLDYLIGFRYFLDCKIDLSYKPLIPREETEYWVLKAIEEIKQSHLNKKILVLDIFSGSGCIGIAILKHLPLAKVVFGELSKKFIKQIELNLKINRISKNRFKIIRSNIFSNLKGKYDFIFANPPYLAKERINKIQKTVLKYEPKSALFGGKDGLSFIKKFLKDAKKFIKNGGVIYLEFDSFQKKSIEKLLNKYSYNNFKFFKDQFRRDRYLKIIN